VRKPAVRAKLALAFQEAVAPRRLPRSTVPSTSTTSTSTTRTRTGHTPALALARPHLKIHPTGCVLVLESLLLGVLLLLLLLLLLLVKPGCGGRRKASGSPEATTCCVWVRGSVEVAKANVCDRGTAAEVVVSEVVGCGGHGKPVAPTLASVVALLPFAFASGAWALGAGADTIPPGESTPGASVFLVV
jgi:hypothetical protein